jgi:hypothetical protein
MLATHVAMFALEIAVRSQLAREANQIALFLAQILQILILGLSAGSPLPWRLSRTKAVKRGEARATLEASAAEGAVSLMRTALHTMHFAL